jgi:hypothetical protein
VVVVTGSVVVVLVDVDVDVDVDVAAKALADGPSVRIAAARNQMVVSEPHLLARLV